MSVPVDPELAARLHREWAVSGYPPGPVPLRPPGAFGPDDKGDPAYALLLDDFTSTPVVFLAGCYICEDPEFAQMGLPLCRKCPECVRQGRGDGHIPADDTACSVCGYEDGPEDYPDRSGMLDGRDA